MDLGGVIGNKVQAMAVEVSTFSINEVVPLSPVVEGHNTDTS